MLALGASSRFTDGPFVLLISDRPTERTALERAIALVMNCRAIPDGAPVPVERPHVIVSWICRRPTPRASSLRSPSWPAGSTPRACSRRARAGFPSRPAAPCGSAAAAGPGKRLRHDRGCDAVGRDAPAPSARTRFGRYRDRLRIVRQRRPGGGTPACRCRAWHRTGARSHFGGRYRRLAQRSLAP